MLTVVSYADVGGEYKLHKSYGLDLQKAFDNMKFKVPIRRIHTLAI